MKPICVPCQRFYRPKKNGYYFVEGMPKAGEQHPLPGTEEPHNWVPYKLWVGDLWWCPDCGSEIVVGVIGNRLAEHYQGDFEEKVKKLGADQLQVNDC